MERAQEYAVFYTEAELKAIQILIEAYIHGHLSKPLTERIDALSPIQVSDMTAVALENIEAERRMATLSKIAGRR